jgi:tetratricopeptide (TPR) repeat protein
MLESDAGKPDEIKIVDPLRAGHYPQTNSESNDLLHNLWMPAGNRQNPKAIAETRTSINLNNSNLGNGYLGLWLAKSGKRDEALRLLNELKQESARNYVQSYNLALIYIGLGDKEEALNYLEKHMLIRAETANAYSVAPELDDLRSEPRFKEMPKRMNLPQ